MSSLDDLRQRPEYRVAALEALVELQRYQIEMLYRQLERYASDIGIVSAVNAELSSDEEKPLNLKECHALISPSGD